MMTCPVCGSQVVEGKKRCPGCRTGLYWREGMPFSVWKSKTAAFIWKVILTLIVVAILIMTSIIVVRGF